MSREELPATKRTWLIIFGALVGAVFLYVVICFLTIGSRKLPPSADVSLAMMRPILGVLGILMLGISIWLFDRNTTGKIGDGTELMSPTQFQSASIVSLLVAEAPAILGLLLFFAGGTVLDYALFGAGTLFVYFAFILPRGLEYWAAWEKSPR